MDETFPVLLKTLSDPSDEVVLLSLEVLAEIVSFPHKSKDRKSIPWFQQFQSLDVDQ